MRTSSVRAGREAGVGGYELLQLGHVRGAALGCLRLDVETEQWLGVGRTDVVPPIAVLDGEPVQHVDRGASLALVLGDGGHGGGGTGHSGVDLSRVDVALVG